MFNGLINGMNDLTKVSNAKSRSISPENFTGEKGKGGMAKDGPARNAARDLGQKWKMSPYVIIQPGETFEMANIEGSGAITHIWLTPTGVARNQIIRMYWDDSKTPSVECPLGDFFGNPTADPDVLIGSIPVCVNPAKGHNCYWTMPFRKNARITLENQNDDEVCLYYQIDYTLTEIEEDCCYFHAQFRRTNPLPYKTDYTIIDGIKGKGHYVGTYMYWGSNNSGWWGEGEIKFFMDGDTEFPTICGTGTEDYFCGAYNFDVNKQYKNFSSPYSGFISFGVDQLYASQKRFSLYRWHITDPIRFEEDLKVTIQAMGWREGGRYLPLQDDLSSVAFWYQTKPADSFPELPDKDYREIR